MSADVYTIGHSVRPLDEFLNILKHYQIQTLADVRSIPYSRRFPHFNIDCLKISLSVSGIDYVHIPGLGGKRISRSDSVNTSIKSPALRAFADIIDTGEFKSAVTSLMKDLNNSVYAVMCAEKDWRKCHRSVISDYLKFQGVNVVHILNVSETEEHSYSNGISFRNNDIIYNK